MPHSRPSRGVCSCGHKARWHFHGKGNLCQDCWAEASKTAPLERELDAACAAAMRRTAHVEPRVDCGACQRCRGALVTQAGLENTVETMCANCGWMEERPLASSA